MILAKARMSVCLKSTTNAMKTSNAWLLRDPDLTIAALIWIAKRIMSATQKNNALQLKDPDLIIARQSLTARLISIQNATLMANAFLLRGRASAPARIHTTARPITTAYAIINSSALLLKGRALASAVLIGIVKDILNALILPAGWLAVRGKTSAKLYMIAKEDALTREPRMPHAV